MAVKAVNLNDGLQQTLGAWFDPGSDWTHSLWVRYDAADYYYTAWVFSNQVTTAIFMASYGYLDDSLPGTPFVQDIEISLNPGFADFYFSEYDYANPSAWTYVTVTYTAGDQTLRMFLNGVQVSGYQPDVTTDLSVGGLANLAYLMTDFASLAGISVAYSGLWQIAMTPEQILAQMTEETPQELTGLIWFTPLPSPADLTDISGNGHDWSEMGSLIEVPGPFDLNARVSQLPLEVAYDMAAWRPYIGGGANGWETPAPPETVGDLP